MKKRKPPVILASMLVVLIGAAVIINLPKGQGPDQQGPKMTAEDAMPDGASRPTPTKDQIKSAIQSTAQRPGDEREGTGDRDGGKVNARTATIFLPRATAAKQMPNDSSVQGQWFRNNARANNPEGFKKP